MAGGKGIVINISGSGEGAAEALRQIEAKMRETAATGKEAGASMAESMRDFQESMMVLRDAFLIDRAFEAIKAMVEKTVDLGMELGHLSEQTGISTENLSTLKFVSGETGVSFDTLTKGFKKLSTTIFELHEGSKLARDSFAALGLSEKQVGGSGNDMYAVMKLVADKFQEMPDGIEKNALATQLFGRAGQALIPILNQGSVAIEEMEVKARSLGVVWDEAGVKKMEDVHRQVADLDSAYQGLSMTLTLALAPALEHTLSLLQQLAGGGNAQNMQNIRAMSESKAIPDDIFGAADPDKIGRRAAGEKFAAAKQLSDLEAQHAKKLVSDEVYHAKRHALESKWNAADLQQNQAYFSGLADQITAAQISLDKAIGQDEEDHRLAVLDSLLARQKDAMDRIDAARHQLVQGGGGGIDLAHAAGKGLADKGAMTIHPSALEDKAIEDATVYADNFWKAFGELSDAEGQDAFDKISKDAQDRIRDQFAKDAAAKPANVHLDEDEITGANQLGAVKRQIVSAQEMADEASHVVGGFLEGLSEQALRGKLDFKSLVDSALADLERFAMGILERQWIIPLMNSLFGITPGFSAGTATSGASYYGAGISSYAMASGGHIGDGGWAIVGDSPGGDMSNAELFAPDGPGTVLPHDVLAGIAAAKNSGGGGGGGAPHVSVNVVNNSSAQVSASPAGVSYDSQARQLIVHTVLEDINQGGPLAGALSGFSRG